jgi:hypothetical protein
MDVPQEIQVVIQEQDEVPTIAGLRKPFDGACPFEIPLDAYTMKPWNNRNVNLSQWFNYGLTPATWTVYANRQMAMYKKSKELERK